MERYEGFKIPKIKNKYILKELCSDNRQCEDYDSDRDFDCDDISCNECLLNNPNKVLLRKWLKTKGNHTPLNKCFNKENNMSININSTVAKVFKDVDEAALVTKWVGTEYEENNHRAFMDLNKNSKLVLAHVIDLEKEEAAKE